MTDQPKPDRPDEKCARCGLTRNAHYPWQGGPGKICATYVETISDRPDGDEATLDYLATIAVTACDTQPARDGAEDATPQIILLRQARDYIRQYIKELGGCDHSVGICCCADIELAGRIEAVLADGEGAEIKCPRCGSVNVDVERARKPFTDSLACGACNYVGPISNPNYPAPPEPAPDAMREALKKPDLAYASTNQIAACRCGSFPTLYGDGARPDDGYRSLWCQTCMEHVAEMKPSEREVIDYWNDLREREHAALSAPVPPADGASQETEQQFEDRLFKQEAADMLRLIDFIADKIGLPHDEELSRDNFHQWFDSRCPSGAVVAEPVAFRWRRKASGKYPAGPWEVSLAPLTEQSSLDLFECEPLYTTPPVRGEWDAIARIIAPQTFAADYQHYYPDRSTVEQFEAYKKADAILSLPVQPGAGELEADQFVDIVIKRMNNLIETYDEENAWENEAAAEMRKAVRILSRQAPHSSSEGGR